MKSSKGTKQEILEKALTAFCEEGYSGTRLQAIADQTGVTKAMIHYYFDTKEKLFQEVFEWACSQLMEDLLSVLEDDQPLFLKIENFINHTTERFAEQKESVGFIISELNNHPEQTLPIFRKVQNYNFTAFDRQLREAADNFEIAPVSTEQVVANILALCMFPYSAEGFLRELVAEDEDAYEAFLHQRKEIVKDTIINWLAG